MRKEKTQISIPRYMKGMSTKDLLGWRGRSDFKSWDYAEKQPVIMELRRRVKRKNPKSPLVDTKIRI